MVYKPPSLWHSVSLNRLRHNRNKTRVFQTEGWRLGAGHMGQVVSTQNDGGREGREDAGGGGGDGGRG